MGLSKDELIQNTHFRVLFIKGLYRSVSIIALENTSIKIICYNIYRYHAINLNKLVRNLDLWKLLHLRPKWSTRKWSPEELPLFNSNKNQLLQKL